LEYPPWLDNREATTVRSSLFSGEYQLSQQEAAMNRYGKMAMDHWSRWRPKNFGTIKDPQTFFQELGEEVEEQIISLSRELAGPDVKDEGFMGKLGRLNMAKFNAEAQVLREMVLLPPEEEEPEAMEPPLEDPD
jgi:hypothetical protein